MARTDTLGNFLTDVADAIREKKGTSETIQASQFDTEIINLPSGGLDWSAIGYSEQPSVISDDFNYAKNIYDNWDSTVTDLGDKFKRDNDLVFFPSVDVSNATSFRSCFYEAKRLQFCPSLNISSACTNLSYMFNNCNDLTYLDLSEANTSNVTSYQSFLYNSYFVKEVNLSSFTTKASGVNCQDMFYYCTSLAKIDMRNFDFTVLSNYTRLFGGTSSNGVPNDCLIIVKDDTQKTWVNTNFSRLTNVQTVEEYEASLS